MPQLCPYSLKDVCQILMHLDIKPRSVLEQASPERAKGKVGEV